MYVYGEWVNMKHLEPKEHDIPNAAVVIEGIKVSRRVNAERKVIKQKF